MEMHEYASIFPMMNEMELNSLREDMKKNGFRKECPITLYQGKILDGRNRFQVARELGLKPTFIDYDGDNPLEYIIALNISRRHLNETQRAFVARKLETFEHGGYRQDANLHLAITREEAARMLNVSPRTVASVKAVEREEPDFLPLMESGEMSAYEAMKKIKLGKRNQDIQRQREEIQSGKAKLPAGLYEIISIDPPWPYGTEYDPEGRRSANPYPEMSLDEIANIQLPASEDCVLWLWTTHKFMRHSFELLDNWGFRDVAILTWVKDRMGLGSWLRSQSEFCIMAVRGHPIINLTNQTTVINGPLREHSRKPDEFYHMVDNLCVGRKLDYFSRQSHAGWDTFGNDTEKFE